MNEVCCFTGPRLHKLPFPLGEEDRGCRELKLKIQKEILQAVSEGFHIFYSGMAMGTDLFCAEAVLTLKKQHPGLRLIAAVPFEGQSSGWSHTDRLRYGRALSAADQVIVLQKEYTRDCFFQRNRFMVDHSSLVIAVYGGSGGGTEHTIKYAGKSGVRIRLIPV